MPKKKSISQYNDGKESMTIPFIIYADMASLLEKINTCYNDPKKSSTTKINSHASSGYSLFTHFSFATTKNKLDYDRGEDCIKKVCKDLRKHATKIISFEKKEMIPLKNEEKKLHCDQKVCYICKK